MNVVVSFSFKEEKVGVVEEFKKIAKREGRDKSKVLVDLIEQYVKEHSAGNPTFTLEQFQDPNFQAVPAYLSDKDKWISHYKNSTDKDKTKLRIQAVNFNKWFRMVDINQ